MRILFTGGIPPFRSGGALTRTQILQGLAARGHEICALGAATEAYLADGDAFAQANPSLQVDRYTLPAIVPPSRSQGNGDDVIMALEARALEDRVPHLARTFGPDVLLIGREGSSAAAPIGRALGLPTVMMVRGMPTYYLVEGTYPTAAARRVLDDFRSVDLFVTASQHLADGLARLGFPNALAVPNAVDLARFQPAPPDPDVTRERGVPPDAQVVLVPAALREGKRIADALEAAALLARSHPNLHWLFAGYGPLEQELKSRCAALGLERRCRWLGWVAPDRMPDLFRAAHIVVLPTEAEGMSRAAIESLAAGRCLIASDIAPNCELIRDGENGLLFKLGEIAQLARQIERALASSNLRGRLGRAAYRSVRGRTLARAVGEHETALLSLLDERRQAAV